ncbi:hypothetical protein NP233_g5072 [Leucocoprinus birnbaumii]|uniref:NACHT domain-containing protein n=1 Tax=Leucocoprinus birnbaumii TaxID=56174 RepID=A0AAD5VTL0_9AGAR|nr:hypothetical protein NP233_g5072 [Leucocoprinus birnbaumii]
MLNSRKRSMASRDEEDRRKVKRFPVPEERGFTDPISAANIQPSAAGTTLIPLSRHPQQGEFESVDTSSCHDKVMANDFDRARLGTSMFTNAHHFTIGTAYLLDGSRHSEGQMDSEGGLEGEAGEEKRAKALEKLVVNGMPGAMLDSKERALAPRCNEDTRQQIRNNIIEWQRGSYGESRRLLWISGPVGVGKSALAQTVAEDFKEQGLLGACFFFSQQNDRRDSDAVIPTIAYQLASILPGYLSIVAKLIADEPLIFNKSHRRQFNDFIIEPIRILNTRRQLTARQTLVIIIDGLDECSDRAAQREFVEMISRHALTEIGSGILWIISSRPEPHLRIAFSTLDCKTTCLQWKLDIDDKEAQEDAMRILHTGFADMRSDYPDQLPEDWPSESQIQRIANRASGHLGFISFFIRFIGDKSHEDPSGRLEVCLRSLEKTGVHEGLNPLHALDLLYTQILSNIPEPILPTTLRILGFFIIYGDQTLTALLHANFLGLDRSTFYRALHHLHSVLYIPPAPEAGDNCLQIYHASFSDYLMDAIRSGRFVIEKDAVHLEVAVQALGWLNYRGKKKDHRSLPKPTWTSSHLSEEEISDSLATFAFTPCWKACVQVSKQSLTSLVSALENFDFDIYYIRPKASTEAFVDFIHWLFSLDPNYPALIAVETWTTGNGRIDMAGKTGIHYFNIMPHSFVTSLIGDVTPTNKYRILLRMGTSPGSVFWLTVNNIGYSYFVDIL